MVWHGILVATGFIGEEIVHKINVIGVTTGGHWMLMKIEAHEDELEELTDVVQRCMKDNFYTHFYNESGDLKVVFKDRIFDIKSDKNTWKEAVNHGLRIGIPKEQMYFYPHKFEDETY